MNFHPAVITWFREAFGDPTPAQARGWPAIARGESTLVLAPTGSGKTLAAFLACLDRLMFAPLPEPPLRCRVLYVSPLKALAVDVERNLRAPIAGISRVAAARGDTFIVPEVAIRTGDTPQRDRARFVRAPADILITTPESLYLMLASRAREALASIDTVIVDEIHSLMPTKRGAHLAISLERLEHLTRRPLQRIGLSATVRPIEEVDAISRRRGTPRLRRSAAGAAAFRTLRTRSRFVLHDEFADGVTNPTWRPVTVVDARRAKALELSVEVPVEDMARVAKSTVEIPSGPASQVPSRASIWTAIHPRLLELIRAHRSTLLFVNSRRLAERLAAALNELAGETLVRTHHGSMAREQRIEVEDLLKAGRVRALVATSTLELGIDMGAVDLVIQIEAPPSVASGLQRIGRASHQVDAASTGVIFPKFRGDLVACAAVTERCMRGASRRPAIRATRSTCWRSRSWRWWRSTTGRSTTSSRSCGARRPFRALGSRGFESVLDMLSGRYPVRRVRRAPASADVGSPRGQADRPRRRASRRDCQRRHDPRSRPLRRVPCRRRSRLRRASANSTRRWSSSRGSARPSCSAPLPGASRRSRTTAWWCHPPLASRARCRSGRATAPAGPASSASPSGSSSRELREHAARLPRSIALERQHDLDRTAGENLLQYLADQSAAGGVVPDDHTIVIERSRDELGDWRVCCLSPLGGKVLIPWAWRWWRDCAPRWGSTSRRCGATTGSWCGCRNRMSRPTRGCSCRRRRGRGARRPPARRERALRRAFP